MAVNEAQTAGPRLHSQISSIHSEQHFHRALSAV